MSNTFTAAMRAEVEAIVARYEALARAHQEAISVAREQESARLKGEIAVLLADRERAKAQDADLRAQIKQSAARVEQLERELTITRELAQRTESARAEAERKAASAIADAERRLAETQAEAEARLAAAQRKAAEAERELTSTRHVADSLNEAFAAERALVEAAQGLDGTLLHEALRGALGADLTASPAVYAQIKARRPDALLSQAIKERGRQILTTALGDREKNALRALAAAAGCELISPEHGARFSPSAMDKASTEQDPAEEGNVLECLMPGLRLAGTEGAMVFPRVVVATG
jgi:DNA repair exonuclease SbcCD ATPase subunit